MTLYSKARFDILKVSWVAVPELFSTLSCLRWRSRFCSQIWVRNNSPPCRVTLLRPPFTGPACNLSSWPAPCHRHVPQTHGWRALEPFPQCWRVNEWMLGQTAVILPQKLLYTGGVCIQAPAWWAWPPAGTDSLRGKGRTDSKDSSSTAVVCFGNQTGHSRFWKGVIRCLCRRHWPCRTVVCHFNDTVWYFPCVVFIYLVPPWNCQP